MNRLLAVTTGENQKTQYTYQETGELIQIIDPYSKLTNFYYDNLGQLTKKVGTRGEITALAYDENGNTVQETTPSGQVKHFYYDNLNQLVRKLLPDDDYNFTYDVRGSVTSVQNLLTKIDLSYQHFDGGDVISQIHSYGIGNGSDLPNTTLSYNYDDVGEKIGMVTPKGTFQYGRDAAGRLRSITNHKGEVFTMKYDLNQRLKEIATPATIASFSFDQSGFNTQIIHTRKSGATIEKFIYGKDEVGNRISKTTTAGTSTYSYDKNYQLIQAATPSLPAEKFTYDAIGNRVSDSDSTYVYDQSNQQVQEDYKYLYTFDANGNMTSKQEKGFTGNLQNYDYNSENQMRAFKLYKNGQLAREVAYTYDALGRRIEKDVVDHEDSAHSFNKRFAYDGSEILFELNESNTITQTYTHSTMRTDDPLSVANASGTFYFIKDGLGSVTDITDSDGKKIDHIDYSAFGKILSITDENGNDVTDAPPVAQSFAFTGREWDAESGLYYYRARYYEPALGRFLTSDPHPGNMRKPASFNSKYIYANNNPVTMSDPLGLWSVSSVFSDVGNSISHLTNSRDLDLALAMTTGIVVTGIGIYTLNPTLTAAGVGFMVGSYRGYKNGGNVWTSAFQDSAIWGVSTYVGTQFALAAPALSTGEAAVSIIGMSTLAGETTGRIVGADKWYGAGIGFGIGTSIFFGFTPKGGESPYNSSGKGGGAGGSSSGASCTILNSLPGNASHCLP